MIKQLKNKDGKLRYRILWLSGFSRVLFVWAKVIDEEAKGWSPIEHTYETHVILKIYDGEKIY